MRRALTFITVMLAGITLANQAQWAAFDDHYFAARAAAGTPTGGIISNYTEGGTNFTSHDFTNAGEWVTFDTGGRTLNIEVNIQAGGGQGGHQYHGGGGGAGGRILTNITVQGIVNLYVGRGGDCGGTNAAPSNGENSVFGNLTAIGGGAGSGAFTGAVSLAQSGGCGGGEQGGGGSTLNPGNGTEGQGYDGGQGYPSPNAYGAGGGGGVTSVGSNGTSTVGGNGGGGYVSTLAGYSVSMGGGGGGAAYKGTPGTGTHGGGNGGRGTGGAPVDATPGTDGTGGGGGGAERAGTKVGGAGGSGRVTLRYEALE